MAKETCVWFWAFCASIRFCSDVLNWLIAFAWAVLNCAVWDAKLAINWSACCWLEALNWRDAFSAAWFDSIVCCICCWFITAICWSLLKLAISIWRNAWAFCATSLVLASRFAKSIEAIAVAFCIIDCWLASKFFIVIDCMNELLAIAACWSALNCVMSILASICALNIPACCSLLRFARPICCANCAFTWAACIFFSYCWSSATFSADIDSESARFLESRLAREIRSSMLRFARSACWANCSFCDMVWT